MKNFIIRICISLFALILFISSISTSNAYSDFEAADIELIIRESFVPKDSIYVGNSKEIIESIEEEKQYCLYLEEQRLLYLQLYSEYEDIINSTYDKEIKKIQLNISLYEYNYIITLNNAWQRKEAAYPTAALLWKLMKNELGWSDAACAGAMGNFMAETGGQTLNLDYTLYDNSGHYYGFAQWSDIYHPEIMGQNLESQCILLISTVKKEIDMWGFLYCENFNYDSFIKMTDPMEAALAFAKTYEKCHSRSYEIRQENAIKAYEYFIGDTRE